MSPPNTSLSKGKTSNIKTNSRESYWPWWYHRLLEGNLQWVCQGQWDVVAMLRAFLVYEPQPRLSFLPAPTFHKLPNRCLQKIQSPMPLSSATCSLLFLCQISTLYICICIWYGFESCSGLYCYCITPWISWYWPLLQQDCIYQEMDFNHTSLPETPETAVANYMSWVGFRARCAQSYRLEAHNCHRLVTWHQLSGRSRMQHLRLALII